MAQHLHLGFFRMVTCSGCCGSCGGARCTSTWPARTSATAAPFLVPFITFGVLCCSGIATFVCGDGGALAWNSDIKLFYILALSAKLEFIGIWKHSTIRDGPTIISQLAESAKTIILGAIGNVSGVACKAESLVLSILSTLLTNR